MRTDVFLDMKPRGTKIRGVTSQKGAELIEHTSSIHTAVRNSKTMG